MSCRQLTCCTATCCCTGWWNTDVSFLTTELPEYAAVTGLVGISPAVVHISAALTYTLLVLA
ncbi:MAG TPA: hypothetical protein VMI73_28585 [Trebonia sp.]|nr:hypothetical protein [Trebonia sp.]